MITSCEAGRKPRRAAAGQLGAVLPARSLAALFRDMAAFIRLVNGSSGSGFFKVRLGRHCRLSFSSPPVTLREEIGAGCRVQIDAFRLGMRQHVTKGLHGTVDCFPGLFCELFEEF